MKCNRSVNDVQHPAAAGLVMPYNVLFLSNQPADYFVLDVNALLIS